MRAFIILFIACLFFSGCTVFGCLLGSGINQDKEIERLKPGEEVKIIMVNGNTTKGQFNGVKTSNLYLKIEEQEWAIPLEDIEQIEIADKKWRFIGAAVGLGIDAAIIALMMAENPVMGSGFRLRL